MSELAEERSIGDGAKRAKIRVNAFTYGGAGAFGLTVQYCLFLYNAHKHTLCDRKQHKCSQIHHDDAGTCRGGKSVGKNNSKEETYDSQNSGADDYTAEAFKDSHGGQCRE